MKRTNNMMIAVFLVVLTIVFMWLYIAHRDNNDYTCDGSDNNTACYNINVSE